jgi:hypothetical protein
MGQQPLVGQGPIIISIIIIIIIIIRHTTFSRTSMDERSARRRDLYLTAHNTNRHPCPQQDSNPQYQQASGRKTTPTTARPLGSALSKQMPIYLILGHGCLFPIFFTNSLSTLPFETQPNTKPLLTFLSKSEINVTE